MIHQHSQLKIRKTVGENRQSIGVFRGKRKGMTLIEVVISLALFSMLSIPVAMFVNTSVSMNKKSELKQQATLLGQSILEELASIDKLLVGINNLFGKGNVEILDADFCDESQYCIKGLELNGFNVNLNFNFLNENKGYIKVLTDNDKYTFSEDNGSNPISPQVTNSFDLFEIDLSVYKKDSTDLLFKGTRVLPLKFE